ncbi:MAG: cell wall hydrolase [Magnetospirillum sp.]|nr:cell wall hydrolase [Magnetospirillum sp.]
MTAAPLADETDILARTLWGEARGEPVAGREAVAWVIRNRVRLAAERRVLWWGTTIAEVCRRPWQFSCWNETDPNRAKIEALSDNDRAFRVCLAVARRVLAGEVPDPTFGATHYHVKGLAPPWSKGKTPSAAIGNHLFFNDVECPP